MKNSLAVSDAWEEENKRKCPTITVQLINSLDCLKDSFILIIPHRIGIHSVLS